MLTKSLLACVVLGIFTLPVLAAEPKPYREYSPRHTFVPHVSGDANLSGTYRHWQAITEGEIDWRLAGDPEQTWKMNWKFMDPPYNKAIHGGYFALDRGEELYARLNKNGQFIDCIGGHKDTQPPDVRTSFPQFRPELKRVAGLEEMIQICAAKQGMTLENGSYDNSAVSLFFAYQSVGIPIKIKMKSKPMRDAWVRGQNLYHMRVGRFNLSCASCHVSQIGHRLRGNAVTTPYGDAAHFPVYRTSYELVSLHMRMIQCNLAQGVNPLKPGSRSYTDLEVFLTGISNGYPVSVPAERY